MAKQKFSDFSGGICDHYIDAPANRAKTMVNMRILTNNTPRTRYGRRIDNETDAQIPSGATRISALINYNSDAKLLSLSERKVYYRNPTNYSEIVGPTSNPVLPSGDDTNYPSYSQWKKQVAITTDDYTQPQIVYADDNGDYQCLTIGLPALASSPTATGAAGANTYIYAFFMQHNYNVGDEVFQFRGPITYVTRSAAATIDGVNPTTIAVIPTLANGATLNYDTATLTVQIYRTQANGTVFYRVSQVTNGTAGYSDTMTDATLIGNQAIYTAGDAVEDEQPPQCAYLHIAENTMVYANYIDGSDTIENGWGISVNGRPFACYSDFRDSVDEVIKGVSSVSGIFLLFQANKISRIDGRYDSFGNGNVTARIVHDYAGCLSHNSIVQAKNLVFWIGNDGVYYSDGYNVNKCSNHINETFRTWKEQNDNPKRIYGTYNNADDTIVWAFQRELTGGTEENDSILVLELRYGVGAEMPFHIWKGNDDDAFNPSALVMFNDVLHCANSNGYVMSFDPDNESDQAVQTVYSGSTYKNSPIIYDLTSVGTDFGIPYERKWIPKLFFQAKNEGDVSVQINVINDDGKITRTLTPIRFRGNFEWGDETVVWGAEGCIWGYAGVLEQWRRLPAVGLRANYIQFQITNSYTVIYNSDLKGDATVDAIAKTVTLGGSEEWSTLADVLDYYISFESDSYSTQYKVTARGSAAEITVEDITNSLPTGSQAWLLKGYRKNEILNFTGVTFEYVDRGDRSFKTFSATQTGNNA